MTAVDLADDFVPIAESVKAENINFSFFKLSVENFPFENNSLDLVNANNSLFFLSKEQFNKTWRLIHNSLTPGGLFIGNLLGMEDGWNVAGSNKIFFTKEELESLFMGYEVLKFQEIKKPDVTVNGQDKFSHTFEFVLRKK